MSRALLPWRSCWPRSRRVQRPTMSTKRRASRLPFRPTLPTRPIVGDDPVAIREALEKLHVKGASRPERARPRLIPGVADKHGKDTGLAAVSLDREVTFLVPVSYGLRYQSQKHLLKVNVDLVDPDGEGRTGILLRRSLPGREGENRDRTRGEGKRLYPADRHHRSIPEKAGSPPCAAAWGCHPLRTRKRRAGSRSLFPGLVRPYLTEHVEHAEPNNDEPTDITTRTSRVVPGYRIHFARESGEWCGVVEEAEFLEVVGLLRESLGGKRRRPLAGSPAASRSISRNWLVPGRGSRSRPLDA